MPITYSIDENAGLIHETWTGEISTATLGQYWSNYLSDARVLSLRRTIVDMRQAAVTFSGYEIMDLIQAIVLPVLKGRHWISAVVTAEPLQVGTARQYQVLAELYSRDAIFHDMEAAQRWIAGLKPAD